MRDEERRDEERREHGQGDEGRPEEQRRDDGRGDEQRQDEGRPEEQRRDEVRQHEVRRAAARSGQAAGNPAHDAPSSPARYGDPFDEGFALAEQHQAVPDFGAALAVYAQLLTLAESLDDSPDVRFLRGHLLSDIATVRLRAADPVRAADDLEHALGLLRGVADATMGPRGRQVWLEVLLKTFMAKAELLRGRGSLDEAAACVDEAAALLPEFHDPEGLRTAEVGLTRVLLLIDRGQWGAAEELATALLSTPPVTAEERPPAPGPAAAGPTALRLLDCLAMICASTNRFDLADDYLARAEEGFRAAGDHGARQGLLAHRAHVVMLRGDLDRAEKLYAEASALYEEQGLSDELAVCEQARAALAERRGEPAVARDLAASSLARFERLGAGLAAADTMLLSAGQAYGRGDLDSMRRLAQGAREVFEERRVYERCAQVDLLLATALEDNLNRTDHGAHEARSVATALGLALPAALALEAARYDFVTAHARSQWLQLADEAMRLAFRLALRRGDQGLLFELVEHRCAGASLSLTREPPPTTPPRTPRPSPASPPSPPQPSPPSTTPGPTADPQADPQAGRHGDPRAGLTFPAPAMKTYGPADEGAPVLGGAAGEAAAAVGLRVAAPPRVLMAPESGRYALQEYVRAAELRYHRRIVSEEAVPFWPPTT
ncbi:MULTISPECIES: hypothetical protein [Streptomyces]|uniref:Tetratricopeptide repeat protein n=1 Tax=Streptomyces doudnae TaxID=3075536 RepID=A0ABD5F166_9ACTN|nr:MULTISPECIES: hypothetical protein [unclassified Streptomyces]MDT0440142.1 hypothetical protein [Streptomyces sp. DSM 41981]SCE42564.1 hypothetical protein GA0115242_13677 [Streptomyces sp. SolWspMP-5a-2]